MGSEGGERRQLGREGMNGGHSGGREREERGL